MQINIQVSYKFISTLWVSKFPTSWYYLYWWAWSSILKVLKLTCFQYLYNISKKKLGKEFIFGIYINIQVSTSWHYFGGSGQTCSKFQIKKFGNIFSIYYEKSVATAFMFYCHAKHSDILRGSEQVFILLLTFCWKKY